VASFSGIKIHMRTSRHRGLSALAGVGSCLGVYVVLAIVFHWLIEPTVAKNRGVIADKPVPAMVMQQPPATFPASAAQLELPSRFVSKPRPLATTAAAPDATDVVPKKTPTKRVARATDRQERPAYRNPWDFAWGGFNRSRPWF
jgi:hypothetical protein